MIVAEYDIDILQKRMTTTEQNLVNYVNQLQTADINLQNNLIQAQIDLMTHIIEVQEQLQTQISNNVNSIVSLQYQDVILGAADSRLANTDSQIQDFNRRQQETLNNLSQQKSTIGHTHDISAEAPGVRRMGVHRTVLPNYDHTHTTSPSTFKVGGQVRKGAMKILTNKDTRTRPVVATKEQRKNIIDNILKLQK